MPDVLPSTVRVFPDWGGGALWPELWSGDPHAEEELARLLPKELEERFEAWVKDWEHHHADFEGWDSRDAEQEWLAQGWELCAALRRALPMHIRIEPRFEQEPWTTLK